MLDKKTAPLEHVLRGPEESLVTLGKRERTAPEALSRSPVFGAFSSLGSLSLLRSFPAP